MRAPRFRARLSLVSALVLGALVIAPSGVSADISFSAPFPIAVQDFPVAVVIADFDGGGADIVAANMNSSSLSFVRGHGNGLFDAPVHIPIGTQPRAVCAADLNGDGRLDLVATQDQGTALLAILYGNGAGGFAAPVRIGTPALPTALVAGDLDGDGDCDLAAALAGPASIHGGWIDVLLNHGAGGFTETIFRVADVENVYSADMHAGDIDGDLDLDLVVTLDLLSINTVMINNGAGAFAAGPLLPIADLAVSNAVADVDGDTDEDVVLVSMNRSLWIFLNNGTGGFSGLPSQAAPTSIHLIGRFDLDDLDGDGRADLVLPDPGIPDAGIAALRNEGAGIFAFEERFSAPGGQVPTFVAIGDLDGSFPPDVVVADRATDQLFVFLGTAQTSVAVHVIEGQGLRCLPSPLHSGQNASIVAEPPLQATAAAGTGILRLIDVRGRAIREWRIAERTDRWAINWNGRDDAGHLVPAGVYFASAQRGSWSEQAKILVLPR